MNIELKELQNITFKNEVIKAALLKYRYENTKKNKLVPLDPSEDLHFEVKPSLTNAKKMKDWTKVKLNNIKMTGLGVTTRDSFSRVSSIAVQELCQKAVEKVPLVGSAFAAVVSFIAEMGKQKLNEKEFESYKTLLTTKADVTMEEKIKATTYVTHHSGALMSTISENLSNKINILISEQRSIYAAAQEIMTSSIKENCTKEIKNKALGDVLACGQREYMKIQEIIDDYDALVTHIMTLKLVIDETISVCNNNTNFLAALEFSYGDRSDLEKQIYVG
ncbi:hypothetical protein MSP8887_01431 [Marinomonas spartinae]|uniref:hypothetical protein n=1 Tax=Marinomonas spartinae TaxID=1792290 RepID=UPI000808F3FD|nr:hypothetical protein [Marinomonas spartinae]SBS31095.1 hypothetical protein MSP8887_01431 [Marinomonas spartinae]